MKHLRPILLTLLLLAAGLNASAQSDVGHIKGTVIDAESQQPVIQAAAMLLSPTDSSLLRGVVSDGEGKFSIIATPGNFIVKISFLGYADQYFDIHYTPTSGGIDLGTISFQTEAAYLAAATVSAKANIVTVVEDTLVYNPAAFRLPEDAMLEDLLKKIPGLELHGNTVLLHGKEISQLFVNGERFFTGNVKTGLKSLTADMVDKINAYERESDFTRMTGVDDGEREPVLDIKIKKKFLDVWKVQSNLGGGTEQRYTGRINANKIAKTKQITIVAGNKNISSQAGINTTSRNQLGTGSAGDRMQTEAGVSFAYRKKELKFSGNIHFDGTDRMTQSRGRTENISATKISYTNANNSIREDNNVFKTDYVLEWNIGKKDRLMLKPSFTIWDNNKRTLTNSSYFISSPYDLRDDPNDWLDQDILDDPLKSIRSYTGDNIFHNYVDRNNLVLEGTYTHRFDKKGRSISFYTNNKFNNQEEDQFGAYSTRYYRIKKNPDSMQVRTYFSPIDNKDKSMLAQVSWNEPIGKYYFLQLTLRTQKDTRDSERYFFMISDSDKTWRPQTSLGQDKSYLNLPANYTELFRTDLSYIGEYESYSTRFTLNMRYVRRKFNLTLGGNLQPQHSYLKYNQNGTDETIENKTLRFSPNLTIRYRHRKTTQLSLHYNSWLSLPTVYQLMPVASGNNPLSVHVGNPNLKAGFVHNMTCSYNYSNIKKQNSFVFNGGFRLDDDKICTVTSYDHDTGIRTTQQGNIDGNWRAHGSLVYNKTLKDSRFSISNHTSAEYQNNVAYLYNSSKKADEVNYAPRMMVKEQFDGIFRNEWLELGLNGRAEYTMERSSLRPDINGDVYNISAGSSCLVTFPWNMRFNTEFLYMIQRGYRYEELNRNYAIWNASIAQPLYKKKLTLRLEAFDLLGQLSNMTRSFSSSSRNVTYYNGVNSYVMLRVICRLGKTGKAGKEGKGAKKAKAIQNAAE